MANIIERLHRSKRKVQRDIHYEVDRYIRKSHFLKRPGFGVADDEDCFGRRELVYDLPAEKYIHPYRFNSTEIRRFKITLYEGIQLCGVNSAGEEFEVMLIDESISIDIMLDVLEIVMREAGELK